MRIHWLVGCWEKIALKLRLQFRQRRVADRMIRRTSRQSSLRVTGASARTERLEQRTLLAATNVTSVVTSVLGVTGGAQNLIAGDSVTFTVNMSGAVIVNTASGSPTLSLNDGGTAMYAGGSGTAALKFVYTVAAGQNTSDLTVTAFKRNGATITNGGTNSDLSLAVTNPAGILQIDTVAPTVDMARVGSSTKPAGTTLQYTVTFSEPVSGVDTSGFSLSTTGVSGASIISVSPGVDAAHYTVNVASGSGAGTIGLNIVGSKIQDLAGNGFGGGSFATQQTFATGTTGSRPYSVALGDLDGDGNLDLVVANYDSSSNSVSVRLGKGDGTFANRKTYATGSNPRSLALGDVNGDGKLDVAVVNVNSGTVSILLGNGEGALGAQQTFATGASPHAVAMGDLNGDGKLDLVVANYLNDTVSVLLGNGNATFPAPRTFATGSAPAAVTLGDINGDGLLDLAVANYSDATVSVLLGGVVLGNWTLATFQTFDTGTRPISVAMGDMNTDGKLDLAVANIFGNTLNVRLGNGTGTFGSERTIVTGDFPRSVALGDLNGDGVLDLAVADEGSEVAEIHFGLGNGTFGAQQTFAAGTFPSSLALGDLNEDGKLDLAIANWGSDNVSVLLNGNSAQAGPIFTVVEPAKVTSVVTSGLGFNGGNGALNAGARVTLTVNFDTDVTLDTTSGSPTLRLNDGGTATFMGVSGSKALKFLYTVAAGQNTSDLSVIAFKRNGATITNGGIDADLTLAVTNPAGSLKIDTVAPTAEVALIESSVLAAGTALQYAVTFSEPVTGVHASSFSLSTTGVSGASITSVSAGVDTAHYTVTVSSGSGAGTIGLNIVGANISDPAGNGFGGGSFAAQQTFNTGTDPSFVTLGDLDADGNIDLVVANETSSTVSVRFGNGDGTFAIQQEFTTGPGPLSVALGDTNSDGKLDMVVANSGTGTGRNSVTVYLGKALRTFEAQQTFATGQTPSSVALGDLNGDGNLDLAVTNNGSTTVSVLLGNGKGSFGTQQTFSAGTNPGSVTIGDVDEDGNLDLIIANQGSDSNSISVRLGNGDGTFAAQKTFGMGTSPRSVTLGDLNGDGILDVAVANPSTDSVSVRLGKGDGTFAALQTFSAGNAPRSLAIGDVNGDGILDLAAADQSGSKVSVLLGSGDGKFAAQQTFATGAVPTSVAMGDVDGDGRLDLIVTNQSDDKFSVLLNGNSPQAGPVATLVVPAQVTSVVTSIIGNKVGASGLKTGDAVTLTVNFDLAVTVDTTLGSPTLRLNDGGTATYAGVSGSKALKFLYTVSTGQNTSDLAVSAFSLNGATITNGGFDSDVSMAVTNPAGTLKIDTVAPTVDMTLVGASAQPAGATLQYDITFSEPVNGVNKNSFSLSTTGVSGALITSVVPGDDDAHYTVNVSSGSGGGTIGLNIVGSKIQDVAGNGFGGGSFAAQSTFVTGSSPGSVSQGDVNRDGKLDLVIANTGSGSVSILLGNGNGTFPTEHTFSTGATPRAVAVGDVNGDGKLDLAVANAGSASVSILLGDGAGGFNLSQTPITGRNPRSVALGDINGDGKLDLAVANYNDASVSVMLGNGDGTFADQTTLDTRANPRSVTLGDMNADGTLDLAVVNHGDDSVSVMLGTGDGTFLYQKTYNTENGPYSVTLGDMNGDGKLDLAVVNKGEDSVSVRLGIGDGTFAVQKIFTTGQDPVAVTLGDVNGDGKLDLAVANNRDDSVSVLLGTGDGRFAAGQTFATGSAPSSVALGDTDGDGKLDLIVTNQNDDKFSVLLNANSALPGPVFTLIAPATVTSVATSGIGISSGTGNLNAGDAVTFTVNFDVAVSVDTTFGSPTLILNDGARATYTGGSGTTALTFLYGVAPGENTADLTVSAFSLNGATVTNGGVNSNLTLAATNPLGTLQIDTVAPTVSMSLVGTSTQTAGTLLQYVVTFSEFVSGVDISEFTLSTTVASGASITSVTQGVDAAHYTVNVSSGSGAGTVGLNIVGSEIRDLAGNGFGGGSFASQQTFSSGDIPGPVTLSDLNGDGALDLIVIAAGVIDRLSVMLGNGDGSFVLQQTIATVPNPTGLRTGDLNGDGKLDLAVNTSTTVGKTADAGNLVEVLLANGDGTFTTGQTFDAGTSSTSLELGDINGDGKLDLVASNNYDGINVQDTVSVLLGIGDGTFAPRQTYATGSQPRSLKMSDLNRDGKLDLAVANASDDSVSVLMGNGDGTFAIQHTFQTGSSPNSVNLGDINGDGTLDLVVNNSGTATVSVLTGNGDGTFMSQQTFSIGDAPISMTLADINGDGKVDLTILDRESLRRFRVNTLLGNGDGTFGPPQTFGAGLLRNTSMTLGDVNGDGKLDVALTDSTDNAVIILLNGNSAQAGPVFTLAQAIPNLISVNPVNITYGTALTDLQLSGTAAYLVNGQSVTVAGTFTYTSAAGMLLNASSTGQTVDVTFTPNDTANYTTGATTVAVHVAKANSTTVVTIASGPFTYNGLAQTPATVSVTGVGGLNLTPTAVYTNNVNAGAATASYSYAGDSNYEASSDSKTFVIGRASTTTVVTIAAGPFTYSGLAQTPATVSVTGVGGLSLTPAALYTNNVNAGTATASYSYAGDSNYEASSDSRDFVIGKASTTTVVTIAAGPFTYTGLAQTPATVSVAGVGGLSLTPAALYTNNTNAGTATASYSYAGDSNYEASSDSRDFVIGKASTTTVVTIAAGPFTFTGLAQTPATVSVTGVGGLSLTPVALYTDNTNAGTAAASYSYAGDSNYEASSDSKNFVIGKASTTTVVTIAAGPFTYTGLAQTPATVSVTGVGGLSLTPAALYTNNTNAGAATASYSYAGDANYEGSSDSRNFVIGKATLSISAVSQSKVFDGTTSASTTPSVLGLVGLTDSVTQLTEAYTSAAVLGTNGSTLQVTPGYVVNDGNNGQNYTVTLFTAPGTITSRPFSVLTSYTTTVFTGLNTGIINLVDIQDPLATSVPTTYTATIDWGDGRIDTNVPVSHAISDGTTIQVRGSHTYSTGGTFRPIVTLSDTFGSTFATTTAETATLYAGTDVSSRVSVTRSGAILNRTAGLYYSTVTINNISGTTLVGDIDLVLINLTTGVTLTNATGSTAGGADPWIRFSTSGLAAGKSISFSLSFSLARGVTSFTYTYKVYSVQTI